MILMLASPARADAQTDQELWAIHGQITFVDQYHPAFTSPYRGTHSLDPGSRGDETAAATLYAGVRPWSGAEIWADPEVDQGYGLSDTYGVAAFPSGEAYKIGSATPYFRLQRLFFRQTIDLGGASEPVAPDANQLGGSRTADTLIITAGKFSVVDIFDTNSYAHDPSSDFLNWGVIDALAFDYAADSWGYSDGAAAEWTQDWWTLRSGLFAMSTVPNGPRLDTDFSQFEIVGEAEQRHTLWGRGGKLKLLGFLNRARMGSYDDAIRLAEETHTTPNTALVRNYKSRGGVALNLEQSITDALGSFLRLSMNDGSQEAYEFSDTNRSLSGGLSLKGNQWQRPDDTAELAFVGDDISRSARAYFADGGLGTLIGDGQLPLYGFEKILEADYVAQLTSWFWATANYQFITNPAYNADRGPVSVLGIRLHARF
ncbi:MAG TPA: carbohydrate porin [Rhizomicrobium sp.]|jgi:high affinity Mn2+ porin|nr:carbohydrate porin [Rhizomicrobium sp.]